MFKNALGWLTSTPRICVWTIILTGKCVRRRMHLLWVSLRGYVMWARIAPRSVCTHTEVCGNSALRGAYVCERLYWRENVCVEGCTCSESLCGGMWSGRFAPSFEALAPRSVCTHTVVCGNSALLGACAENMCVNDYINGKMCASKDALALSLFAGVCDLGA